MGRTKTQPSSKQQSKAVPMKSAMKKIGSDSQTLPTQESCKIRTKRLTMKQLTNRKLAIFQMIMQANKQHEEEKNKFLKPSKKRKNNLKFNNLVEFSSGEKIIAEFPETSSQSSVLTLSETNSQDNKNNIIIPEIEPAKQQTVEKKSGKKSKKVIITKDEMRVEKENLENVKASNKRSPSKA